MKSVPVFVVHEGFQLSSVPGNRIVSNHGVLGQVTGFSPCPKDTTDTQKQLSGSPATRIIMLKLASTGSSWVGGLLHDLPNVKFHAELITGRIGSNMSDVEKLIVMEKGLWGCKGKALCGFSINSKNAANLDFPNFAATQNAKLLSKLNRPTATLGQINHPTLHSSHGNLPLVRTVVWVRCNLVAYTVGLWRSSQLKAGPCGVNNQKSGSKKAAVDCKLPASNVTFPLGAFVWLLKRACEDKVLCGYSNSHNQKVGDSEAANDCKLPASNVTLPLSDFVKNLKKAQFFHAINLGIAYRHWKPTAPVPQGTPCVDGGAGGTSPQTAAASMSPSSINRVPIYELYYEDMLRDKASTLKVLLAWLGVRYDLPVPKDKVVKSTPATLHGLLQNFDEIRDWLRDHSQCLLAHLLDPQGTQVMPPCSFHFNPDEDEGSLFASVARRRKDPVPTNASV
eukprot:CAMPEP_0171755838 /NCGR_PEP_ID=MMETSP0991-20121206/44700_1 /TAXON_ID=483369 /ORGANISM="non described non described, Strain CCMP2098" /LENGTH=450 /DNA_ID=CAMNT_0012357989 /DNA_START=273 /DNA_END=1622 /DNA_ORIENTATION=+